MTGPEDNRVSTSTLFRRLFKASNLEGFIENNADIIKTPSFHTYISELCRAMHIIPEQVIKSSSIERSYDYRYQ